VFLHFISARDGLYDTFPTAHPPWLRVQSHYFPLMAQPPLADFLFANLPQLSNSWHVTRRNTLHHLYGSSNHSLSCNLVCSGLSLHADDADSWIILATIMCAVTKIAEPGFQGRGVVSLDSGTVGDDAGFARDRSPLAGTVEERDVDSVVGGDVVSLARFGIGVKYEVDATRFLQEYIVNGGVKRLG
jgi:hypothetical protein